MAWLCLFVAGLFEIGWAIGLKYTEGFTRLVPSAADHRGDGHQHGAARPCAEDVAGRHRLCGVDRHRRGRHRGARHLSVRRAATAARLASMGLIVAGIVGLKLVT